MCIRDRAGAGRGLPNHAGVRDRSGLDHAGLDGGPDPGPGAVSYTHLRAHETVLDLVCRLLLDKKKKYLTSPQCREIQQLVWIDSTILTLVHTLE